jgi:ribonuclease HI
MELMAAIASLGILKESCEITLYSDSKYLVDAMTKGWLGGWKKRGWIKSDKKPVLNRDLWEQLDQETGGHTIVWKWVKGHSGNTFNERCDALVHEAIDAGKFIEDSGYLAQQAQDPELFG